MIYMIYGYQHISIRLCLIGFIRWEFEHWDKDPRPATSADLRKVSLQWKLPPLVVQPTWWISAAVTPCQVKSWLGHWDMEMLGTTTTTTTTTTPTTTRTTTTTPTPTAAAATATATATTTTYCISASYCIAFLQLYNLGTYIYIAQIVYPWYYVRMIGHVCTRVYIYII